MAATDQVSTTLDDEVVILNLSTGTYFGLNEVGTTIWETLAQPRTIPELRDAVAGEFDVSTEVAERDVRALVDGLIDAGLVTRIRPADRS